MKKDTNVNTLFPVELLEKLDDWAWRHRLTRSAALRAIVESAFNSNANDQKEASSDEAGQEDTAAASSDEAVTALESQLESLNRDMKQALEEVAFRSKEVEQIKHITIKQAHAIESIKAQLAQVTDKMDA